MTIDRRCKTCGEPYPSAGHICSCKWDVWEPDNGETRADAHSVHADSPAEAAERFASRLDRDGDRQIAFREETVRFAVAQPGNDAVRVYSVSGEMRAEYYTRLVTQ